MAERRNFYIPDLSAPCTEEEILQTIVIDDDWISMAHTLMGAKKRWPEHKIFKVTISVEEM